jgi:hypothetical protein
MKWLISALLLSFLAWLATFLWSGSGSGPPAPYEAIIGVRGVPNSTLVDVPKNLSEDNSSQVQQARKELVVGTLIDPDDSSSRPQTIDQEEQIIGIPVDPHGALSARTPRETEEAIIGEAVDPDSDIALRQDGIGNVIVIGEFVDADSVFMGRETDSEGEILIGNAEEARLPPP